MFIIPALEWLRQKDCLEFKVGLGHKAKPCPTNNKETGRRKPEETILQQIQINTSKGDCDPRMQLSMAWLCLTLPGPSLPPSLF